ncbi:MAG TPA: hypothetical protein VFR32_07755 [Gaiellaceae bacterium]|nr:hypothetical protein [Gaiellaceae bacterium]
MSNHALTGQVDHGVGSRTILESHWTWLGIGFAVAFATPFLLADALDVHRDLFYGLYAAIVATLFLGWSRATGYDLVAAIKRRWILALALGLACGAVLAVMVIRTEDGTSRPDAVTVGAEVAWRGVLYGVTDGLLLSAFPILVVFAAFADRRFARHWTGKVAIGALALVASIALTAVYHAGYSDFRSSKMTKPITGDVIWSVPTLVTLNPIGAPIAHAGLHVSAVLHSYETDTFLPPHE